MSLYNTAYANAINIRSNKAYSEELYTKDPLTGLMERVLPGGGGGTPGDLPYWVQANRATIFDNATRENVELNKTGLTVETVADGTRRKTVIGRGGVSVDNEPSSTGSLLTSSALTFGDSLSGNLSYTKAGAKILAELTARVTNVNPSSIADKILLYNSTTSTFQSTFWRNYLKTETVEFNNGLNSTTIGMSVTPTTPAITIQNASSSGNRVSISPSGITLDRKDGSLGSTKLSYSAISTSSASGTSSAEINLAGELRLKNSGLSLTLDVNRLNDLIKLYEKTALASITAANKLLLWNPTSQVYNYADIPAGIVLPSYLKENRIFMDSNYPQAGFIELNKSGDGTITSSRLDDSYLVTINGQAGAIDVKNAGGQATIYKEDVDVTNKLKALGTAGSTAQMLTYVPSTKVFAYQAIPSAAPRFRYWKPTEISYSRFVNGGLITGGTTYSNRTLLMTAPSIAAFQYPSSIGGVGDELEDGDIFYADFSSLPPTNFTTAAKKAVFPIIISGAGYDPLVSYPILEALVDIDSKVKISIEPGLYETPDKPSGTRCHLIIAEFTGGESSYPWFARIPIKVHKKKYNFSDTI